MRWEGRRESENIEDRRGAGFSVGRAGGIGIGTIVLALVAMFFGVDPSIVLQNAPSSPPQADVREQAPGQTAAAQDEMRRFVAVVLADTEDVWNEAFRRAGKQYREPKLVIYTGGTRTGCGVGQAAMGPFYCPQDQNVYIDLAFYEDMRRRFKAPGDFAQAYVIAHEVGHHVQTLLGISDKVRSMQSRASEEQSNAIQVRMELQADCFAGVWANRTQKAKNILEAGDVEEALNAASAIGDDRLQQRSQGYVVPESFTHGSSDQRVRWFRRGIETGDMRQCDTFGARQL